MRLHTMFSLLIFLKILRMHCITGQREYVRYRDSCVHYMVHQLYLHFSLSLWWWWYTMCTTLGSAKICLYGVGLDVQDAWTKECPHSSRNKDMGMQRMCIFAWCFRAPPTWLTLFIQGENGSKLDSTMQCWALYFRRQIPYVLLQFNFLCCCGCLQVIVSIDMCHTHTHSWTCSHAHAHTHRFWDHNRHKDPTKVILPGSFHVHSLS